jgi:hypothetical protein
MEFKAVSASFFCFSQYFLFLVCFSLAYSIDSRDFINEETSSREKSPIISPVTLERDDFHCDIDFFSSISESF